MRVREGGDGLLTEAVFVFCIGSRCGIEAAGVV